MLESYYLIIFGTTLGLYEAFLNDFKKYLKLNYEEFNRLIKSNIFKMIIKVIFNPDHYKRYNFNGLLLPNSIKEKVANSASKYYEDLNN